MKPTNKYWWMVVASAVGLISAFWQLSEKLTLLKSPKVALSCNFNSTFNCSNVLNAHQSSVFGPPNSVIGLIMFTFFLTVGIVLLSGARLARRMTLAVQALALFMLGFTVWFLFESTFRIRAVCIFCLFIGTAVLIVNAVLARHNFAGHSKFGHFYMRGADLFFWALIWLAVAFAMLLKFA